MDTTPGILIVCAALWQKQGLRPMEQITTPVYTHEQVNRMALGIFDYANVNLTKLDGCNAPVAKALAIYVAAKSLVEALK